MPLVRKWNTRRLYQWNFELGYGNLTQLESEPLPMPFQVRFGVLRPFMGENVPRNLNTILVGTSISKLLSGSVENFLNRFVLMGIFLSAYKESKRSLSPITVNTPQHRTKGLQKSVTMLQLPICCGTAWFTSESRLQIDINMPHYNTALQMVTISAVASSPNLISNKILIFEDLEYL